MDLRVVKINWFSTWFIENDKRYRNEEAKGYCVCAGFFLKYELHHKRVIFSQRED